MYILGILLYNTTVYSVCVHHLKSSLFLPIYVFPPLGISSSPHLPSPLLTIILLSVWFFFCLLTKVKEGREGRKEERRKKERK